MPTSLLSRPTPEAVTRPALLGKGFRPFFLLAAAFAVLFVPLWLIARVGHFDPGSYLVPMYWHGHEMIFGFTVAVIAGFLLTAVGNWTKRETAIGPSLAALGLLWLAGRIAMLFGAALPAGLAAAIDLCFVPALGIAIGRPLFATGNRRNYAFVAILAVLFATNLAVHLDALGVLPGAAPRALTVAVDLIVLVILVVAGRIIPMFTRNATRVQEIRNSVLLDRLTLAAMVVVVALDALGSGAGGALAATVTGVLAALRATHWGTRHTLRHPLLWVLHVGYLWVPAGLLLRGVCLGFELPSAAATHALTVGGVGMLTLGMMARVALGHTGRMLHVGWPMALAFGLMAAAAALRVATALIGGTAASHGANGAGSLMALAFALYLVVYLPILIRPRIDGRAG